MLKKYNDWVCAENDGQCSTPITFTEEVEKEKCCYCLGKSLVDYSDSEYLDTDEVDELVRKKLGREKREVPVFVKHDQGKAELFSHWIPEAHEVKSRVMSHGAAKYGADNFKNCTDPNRYLDAAMRHLAAMRSNGNESTDEESGLLHVAHAATCLDMALYTILKTQTPTQ